MRNFIAGILDNDSAFGRAMNLCWIIFASNLMFIIFSIPIVTMGPALVALFHVMLKMLRGDQSKGPIAQFWIGFKNNIKQAIVAWIIFLALAAFAYVDIRFCNQTGGILTYFKYAIYVIAFFGIAVISHLMPVIAAFADTLPHLVRNAVFFAARNPVRMIVLVVLNIAPIAITYIDTHMQPLYVFLWVCGGFALVAYIESRMLLKDFARYLPKVNEYGEFIEE